MMRRVNRKNVNQALVRRARKALAHKGTPIGDRMARLVLRRAEGKDPIVYAGFAIMVGDMFSMSVIEEAIYAGDIDKRFVDKDALLEARGSLNDEGYDQLEDDISTIEGNALKWLKATFFSVSDRGHSSNKLTGNKLIGNIGIDTSDKDQVEYAVNMLKEPFTSGGGLPFYEYRGTSSLAQFLDCEISIFDVDEDDLTPED